MANLNPGSPSPEVLEGAVTFLAKINDPYAPSDLLPGYWCKVEGGIKMADYLTPIGLIQRAERRGYLPTSDKGGEGE
jgi:hypothetical protein